MTEGLAQRMEQELGCPCTLVFTGGLGRFVAPRCRREAVYDEDLLLRGLWKRCTANCPSADKPEKTIRDTKKRLGIPGSLFSFSHHRESRPYGKNTRTAHAAAMKAAASAASAAGTVWRVRRMPAAP